VGHGGAGASRWAYCRPVRDGRYVVVIVDDHALFSQGLALLLESRAGEKFVVAGSTTAGEEAVALVGREGADIAIVDLALPPLGGVETIRRITAGYPRTRILALSGTEDLGLAAAALRAGAAGFLGKSADPEVLVAPLLTIAAGVRVVRADLLDALLAAGDRSGGGLVERLDGRELQLWVLLAKGLETSEIAKLMLVSERTAKRMIASLLHKLGVANRIEAAALAGRYGLLDDEHNP
jgi:DNA-binding NarL/FixJ family response regulator